MTQNATLGHRTRAEFFTGKHTHGVAAKVDPAGNMDPSAQAPCEFHCWVCSDRKRCIFPLYHSGSHECPSGHRW